MASKLWQNRHIWIRYDSCQSEPWGKGHVNVSMSDHQQPFSFGNEKPRQPCPRNTCLAPYHMQTFSIVICLWWLNKCLVEEGGRISPWGFLVIPRYGMRITVRWESWKIRGVWRARGECRSEIIQIIIVFLNCTNTHAVLIKQQRMNSL